MATSFRIFMSLCVTALLITGCTPYVTTRGNLVQQTKLDRIQPNVTSQYDVTELLGPPTMVSPFEEEKTWYYAGHKSQKMGIFKDEVTERRVVSISFDDMGGVTNIRELDPENVQDVEFVERKTPTAGKEFTFLQQFIGNIGRFNTGGGQRSSIPNQ